MAESEAYAIALKNTINEVRNICRDIQHTFIFNETGEIITGDADTPQNVMLRVIETFNDILERAETVGGVESINFEGEKGKVKLSCFGKYYLVMVANENADMNYVGAVTRVLIPTVLQLIEKLGPTPTPAPSTAELEAKLKHEPVKVKEEPEEIAEEPKKERAPSPAPEIQPLSVEPKAVQLIVENIQGFRLFTPSDTVLIEGETLLEWEQTYGGKGIELVDIETFEGKTLRCKVKPIKDSKYIGKGVVQIPEKAQQALEIHKGELVRVKPVFE
jgi:hypothetical protein